MPFARDWYYVSQSGLQPAAQTRVPDLSHHAGNGDTLGNWDTTIRSMRDAEASDLAVISLHRVFLARGVLQVAERLVPSRQDLSNQVHELAKPKGLPYEVLNAHVQCSGGHLPAVGAGDDHPHIWPKAFRFGEHVAA